MRDEEYFYPHFGLFNEGVIRISPTFVASDNESGLLRALNIVHRDWSSNVVRIKTDGGGSSYEYRGICDFNDSVETSYVAGVCSLRIFESTEQYKMILQLEPGDGDGAVTSISLKRDPPGENFLGWILKKSIDVARSGNKTLRNLDRSFASDEGNSKSRLDESTQGEMVKNSGEFKEMVMEYMSRDAATFAAAESQLDNLSTWFRDQRDKLSSSVLEMSRDDGSPLDQSVSRTPTHSPSRLRASNASTSASVSSPYKVAEAKQNAQVREQMGRFRENVEKSIDSAFANSLDSSDEVLVKLYYTGKDPRIPEKKKPEYQYEEGADPASFQGYVQERSGAGVTTEESQVAIEELEGQNQGDYQQLKRALGRFQGDVESLIKESFEENEDYRRSLGLDSSFQSNLGKVGVSETPLRKGRGGRNVDDDEDDVEDAGDDEVTVEEEAAEVQAILQGFLMSHHREDWGHTTTKPHPSHPSHPHHPDHHLHRKHSLPHYMVSTESSSHHEVDLGTKLHVHESMEGEESHRSAHHNEQQMIDSIFGHGYDAARTKDKHHGVHHTGHAAHSTTGIGHRPRTGSTASISSVTSHMSTASARTHGTTSSPPSKKVTKVSSSLLAPTAASKAHHSPETKKTSTSSPTKSKSGSIHSSSSSISSHKSHAGTGSGSKTSKTVSSAASVDSHETSHSKVSVKSVASSVASKKAEKVKKEEKTVHASTPPAATYAASPLAEVMKIAAEIPVDDPAAPLSVPSLGTVSAAGAGMSEEDSPSPFGLISEASSIGPAAQGTSSGFASPVSAATVTVNGAPATAPVSAAPAAEAATSSDEVVSASTVAAATLASLEAHYEEEDTRRSSRGASREEAAEGEVDLESSEDEEARASAAATEPGAPGEGHPTLDALLGISEGGAADTSMASQERRQHDASWDPPRESYLHSTFTSAQHEQDNYTKAHTLEMIFDEEKARHRHHKNIMDPEKAYAKEHTDSVSVTSSISDWTIEKETKKKVKRLKKGKKAVKKK